MYISMTKQMKWWTLAIQLEHRSCIHPFTNDDHRMEGMIHHVVNYLSSSTCGNYTSIIIIIHYDTNITIAIATINIMRVFSHVARC